MYGGKALREIGGYIELDDCYGQEYHKNALALNSGRHCLEYLIRAKHIKKILIPFFLCASVSDICKKNRCEIEYYEISDNFLPCFNKDLENNEWLYIVNYYGQISNDVICRLKANFGNIIIDNAQAFYQYPVNGVDTLYTCRKFFGVSDGGYLYTDIELEDVFSIDISYERIKYILGRYEIDAQPFYQDSVTNNKIFAKEPLKRMSRLTHNLLKRIDYELVKEKREENYKILQETLESMNSLYIKSPEAPFMYPLYLKKGMEVKKRLIAEKIYIPTLWPDVFKIAKQNDRAWDYAENILPLPCDQRYGKDDMEYMLDILKKVIEF